MANLTIAIDDDVLHRARRKALEEHTTVNGLLRGYLERYVGADGRDEAMARFLQRARRSRASSGPAGRTWRRDDLHDR